MLKLYKQPSKILVFFLFTLLLFPLSAFAIEFGGLGGRPANPDPAISNSDTWFIYNLDPGSSKEDAIVIQNITSEDERVIVYAADSTPSSDGGFALKQKVETMTGVGTWLKFFPDNPPDLSASLKASLYDPETNLDLIIERCQVVQIPFGTSETGFIEYLNNSLKQLLSSKEVAYLTELYVWCQGTPEVEFDLPSQDIETIPFIISIPHEIDVGEHTGGILIQRVKSEEATGEGLRLSTRVGVRVYQTVPGEIIRDVSATGWQLRYDEQKQVYIVSLHLQNNGNVSQPLDIDFVVEDLLFGKNNFVLGRSVQVLRDSELITNFEWPPLAEATAGEPEKKRKPSVKFGRFALQADIKVDTQDGEKIISTPVLVVWLVPWLEIFIGFIILLFIISIFFYWWYTKNKLASHQGWQAYKIKKSDTLSSLASKHGVTWRKIVLVNKLSKPYSLTPGQILQLPALQVNQGKPAVSVNKLSEQKVLPKFSAKARSVVKPIASLTAGVNLKTKPAKPVLDSAALVSAKKVPAMASLEPVAARKYSRFWYAIGLVVIIAVALFIFKPSNKVEDLSDNTNQQEPASGQVYNIETGEFKDLYPSNDVEKPEPKPEPENEAIVDVEPEILITPVEIDLQVLNGSGVKGAAGKLVDQLEKLGFSISFTGNANRFDYQNMTVIYKAGQEDKFDLVEQHLIDLGYLVVDSEDIGTSDTVIIIVGK